MLDKEQALMSLSRQECFERGYLTVKDLDDEELRYGRCRDEHGYIAKKMGKTELIPKEMYLEFVAEHELRFKQKLRQRLDDAIDVIVDIMNDETAEPKERFEAAKYVFERTAGKTAETVNINVKTAPWEDLLSQLTGIAPISRSEHRAIGHSGIVEAEFEEIPDDQEVSVADAPPDTQEASQASQPIETPVEPEPYTQADGPTAESMDYDIEQVRAERHAGTIEVDNEKPVYNTEGDIHTPGQEGDQYHNLYGRRADQKRSYVDQARAAEEVARRRKENREKRNGAKKQRKIARAMGADQIKDEITGFTVSDGPGQEGNVHFDSD